MTILFLSHNVRGRSLDAATTCMARVICLMFRALLMRRRISRWLAIHGSGHGHARKPTRTASTASPRAVAISSLTGTAAASSVSGVQIAING